MRTHRSSNATVCPESLSTARSFRNAGSANRSYARLLFERSARTLHLRVPTSIAPGYSATTSIRSVDGSALFKCTGGTYQAGAAGQSHGGSWQNRYVIVRHHYGTTTTAYPRESPDRVGLCPPQRFGRREFERSPRRTATAQNGEESVRPSWRTAAQQACSARGAYLRVPRLYAQVTS